MALRNKNLNDMTLQQIGHWFRSDILGFRNLHAASLRGFQRFHHNHYVKDGGSGKIIWYFYALVGGAGWYMHQKNHGWQTEWKHHK